MEKYAKSQGAKVAKKRMLLDEVQRQFSEKSFDAIKVEEVAKRCEVSKGTVFNYFESKETLFLALLMREYNLWFVGLEHLLAQQQRLTEKDLARLLNRYIDQTLDNQKRLFSLIALGHSRLEHNVNLMMAESYRRFINERGAALGYQMAQQCDSVTPIKGIKLMMTLHTFFVGHAQVAELPSVMESGLTVEAMEHYEIDLRVTLLESMKIYMLGLFNG